MILVGGLQEYGVQTGRAISTPIFDIRMNDLLKYFTAFAASSGVL